MPTDMNSPHRVVKIRISPGTVAESAELLQTIADIFQGDDLEISILDEESSAQSATKVVHIDSKHVSLVDGNQGSVVVNMFDRDLSEKEESVEILAAENTVKDPQEQNAWKSATEKLKVATEQVSKTLALNPTLLKALEIADPSANIFLQAEKNLNRHSKA